MKIKLMKIKLMKIILNKDKNFKNNDNNEIQNSKNISQFFKI